jgi:hypothetical protein
MLNREGSEILLDELEELVETLRVRVSDAKLKREVRRRVQGLDELPGPPALLEERITGVKAWVDMALESGVPPLLELGEVVRQ